MSILTFSTLILTTLTSVRGLTPSYSSTSGSIPSVVEIWEPDVTVTEHFTSTVHKTCPTCQTGAASEALFDLITSSLASTATPLWNQPSSPSATTTLMPVPHWDQDASNPKVLVPDQKVQMYYAPAGSGNQETAHSFQWINTTLSVPSVPLHQSALINYTWSAGENTLYVTFSSAEAFNTAQSNWAVSNVLVAHTQGCGDFDKGDSCYIQIEELTFGSSTYSCKVTGRVLTLKQCLVLMNASWGKYSPAGKPSQSAYRGDFSAAALNVWSSVFSKYVTPSSGGGRPIATVWSYTPAGAAAGGRRNGAAGGQSNWAYGRGTVTGSASITSATITNAWSGSGQNGLSSPRSSGTSGDGSSNSFPSGDGSSKPTTASPKYTVTSSGPIQTSTTTASYGNATGWYPYGNGTTASIPYGGTGTSATITSPAMTTTTTGSFSSVVSSLSSIFSSMSVYNSTSSSSSTQLGSPSFKNGTISNSNNTLPVNSTTGTNRTSVSPVSNCTRGTDPVFGLPTTCIGPAFDIDLDSIDGFLTLDRTDFAAIVELFPGLITRSVLSNTKRGMELSKRCAWYDVVCLGEEAVSKASSVVSSVGSVIVSDATSVASAIGSAATDLANTIVHAAEAAGQEVSEAAAEVIADLEKGLSELLDYKTGTATIPINIAPGSSSLQNSPWGQQALLYNVGKKSSNESKINTNIALDVYCVDCGITGTVELYGEVAVDLTGIKKLMVGSQADLDLVLGIGLDAEAELSQTFSFPIFQEGIPEFCSGSTLCIGPYVKLAADLTLKAEANGYLMVGGHWAITAATAQLWAYGGTSNANGWTPTFTPKYNAGGKTKLSVQYGMPLSVGCGITILDGTFSENAELSLTPSIQASATAAVNVTSDGTKTGTTIDTTTKGGKCDGIDLSLDWNIDLSYNVLNLLKGDLWNTGEQNIAETCIAWDSFIPKGNSTANSTTPVGFGSGSGNLTSTYSDHSLIDTADSTPLIICGNGDVYKVDSGYSGADSSCTTTWLAYSGLSTNATASNSNTSSIVADISRRLPVVFPDVLSKTGVSRLRLVDSTKIPAKSEYVAFDYQTSAGWLGVDRNGKKYQPVQCRNLNSTAAGFRPGMNEVFMVPSSASDKGVGILNANEVVYSVSNGYVYDCRAMRLSLAAVTPIS